jgi:hypothetical protein
MNNPKETPGYSRRRFVEKMAQGTVLAGTAAFSARPLFAVEANPFAYDVSRFSKTDPALIAWEEVSRRVCPGKGVRRMAFGPNDVLHVAAEGQIVRLGANGTVSSIAAGATVTCVAVAGDGTVYASLRDHVAVFDATGRRSATWEAPDKRTWISSLALGAGGLFAADSGNRVILRYDLSGKVTGRIGAKNAARNIPGLIVPSPFLEVKFHADGLLRVNNPGRHRFEAYTIDGDFESAWGAPSLAIAGFCGCCNPIGLALLPDGRTVTCEKGLPRVKVYRADGTFESVVAGPESFAANVKACADPGDCTKGGLDAAVDAQGRIHILDRVTAEIRVLQPKRGRA